MNRRLIVVSITIFFAIGCLLYLCRGNKKVYIRFEDIKDYSFEFAGKDTLRPEKVVLKQLGALWFQRWEFDLDNANAEKISCVELNEIDVVSQYWIINNLNGFTINFDYGKTKRYKLHIIRELEDEFWIYPVMDVHFLTE